MKIRIELIISVENDVDLCFDAKKTCDNDGPPYTSPLTLSLILAKRIQGHWGRINRCFHGSGEFVTFSFLI